MSTSVDGNSSPESVAPAHTAPTHARLTRLKLVGFIGVLFALLLILGELAVRVGFYVVDDFNKYYLTFGFVPDIEYHSAEFDGYAKFPPNSVAHNRVSRDHTLSIRINGDGFRSTRDFVRPKPPGTLRIITLGESSTFGLTNEDNETYPAILEERLRSRVPIGQVEVYNLGIPHYRADNILALARAELAALEPDIVTFYAGYNNSWVFRSPKALGAGYRLKDWLKFHSVAYRALHPYVVNAFQVVSKLTQRDVVGIPHLGLPIDLSTERVGELRSAARQEFGRDLDSLVATVERIGATPVLITQTFTISRIEGFRIEGPERTYAQEVAFVDSLLSTNGKVVAPYSTLLIHRDLIEVVRETARRRNLVLVEGIETLDRDRREVMASFVHLTREGNTRLAAAIESALLASGLVPYTIPDSTAAGGRNRARSEGQR